VWVAKLPWAKSMVEHNKKFNMVCYKVSGKVDGIQKLLIPKFDSLQKHSSRQKCKITHPWFGVGQYFIFLNY
jgi:hypothetical protein